MRLVVHFWRYNKKNFSVAILFVFVLSVLASVLHLSNHRLAFSPAASSAAQVSAAEDNDDTCALCSLHHRLTSSVSAVLAVGLLTVVSLIAFFPKDGRHNLAHVLHLAPKTSPPLSSLFH